jgi:hypothetical protein
MCVCGRQRGLIVASSLARDLAESRFAQLAQLDLGDLVEESA